MTLARLPTIAEITSPVHPVRYVYAAFDGDEIVYVGMTYNTVGRWNVHRRVSDWCVPGIEFRVLSTHGEDARKAERLAIREHRPKFNRQSNPDFKLGQMAYVN